MRLILNNIAKYASVLFIIQTLSCVSLFVGEQYLKDFLPRETELFTWKLKKTTVVNDSKQILALFPEFYAYYPIAEFAKGEYISVNNDLHYAAVSIIQTIDSNDAFGLFTRERAVMDATAVNNAFAVYGKSRALSFKGNVFIIVETNVPDYLQTQKMIISVITAKMQDVHAYPDTINLLSGFIDVNSVVVHNEGIVQIPHIKNIIAAQRSIDSKDISSFYRKYSSRQHASQEFKNLIDNDRAFMITESSDVKIAFKGNNADFIFVAHIGEWITGIYGINNVHAGKKLIRNHINELRAL